MTGTLYCQQAPSFGWDVKPRSWLSVVIKKPRMSFEKSRGVTSASWPIAHWPLTSSPYIDCLHHSVSSPPISWCVVSGLAHYGCRRIIQVDAAHWTRRHPPSQCRALWVLRKALYKCNELLLLLIITMAMGVSFTTCTVLSRPISTVGLQKGGVKREWILELLRTIHLRIIGKWGWN